MRPSHRLNSDARGAVSLSLGGIKPILPRAQPKLSLSRRYEYQETGSLDIYHGQATWWAAPRTAAASHAAHPENVRNRRPERPPQANGLPHNAWTDSGGLQAGRAYRVPEMRAIAFCSVSRFRALMSRLRSIALRASAVRPQERSASPKR